MEWDELKIVLKSSVVEPAPRQYSFMPNCIRGSSNSNFLEKDPPVHLIIITVWPKNTPPPFKKYW